MKKQHVYKISRILLPAIFLILSGCARSTESVVFKPVDSPNAPARFTTTIAPETLESPTITSSYVTVTPSTVPSVTHAASSLSFRQNCISVIPDIAGDYSGKIVFEKWAPGPNISMLDLTDGKVTELPVSGVGVTTSPNRKMFAYQGFLGEETNPQAELLIIDATGKQIKEVTSPDYWDRIERWLDDESLFLVLGEPMEPGAPDRKYPEPVVVLDHFLDRSKTLQSDYPGIDTVWAANFYPWLPASTTVYHHDLRRVIYPSPKDGVVLYGIPERKIISTIEAFDWRGHPPVWSPDGTEFILMGDDEFYLITYEGKVKKLTQLNPGYERGKTKSLHYQAKFYSWSPDNRHVAFWLNSLETNQISLAILDTLTGSVIDFCITPGFDPHDFDYSETSPVWAPDGRSFVTAANFNSAGSTNDVVLVDIDKNLAYKIYGSNKPVGWLDSH